MTQSLWRGVSDETFCFLLGLVMNRFEAHHVPSFSCPLMNHGFGFLKPLRFRHSGQQTGGDEYRARPALRGHQNDAGRFGLIVEPIARSDEDEDQDEADDDIVLPGTAREIPLRKTPSDASAVSLAANRH